KAARGGTGGVAWSVEGHAMSDPTDRCQLGDDDPMTLQEACELVFRGNVTPATLRVDEASLAIERIGKRDFVTPRAIREMREQFRLESAPGSISRRAAGGATAGSAEPCGSSSTEAGVSPQDALREMLSEPIGPSSNTFKPATNRPAKNAS